MVNAFLSELKRSLVIEKADKLSDITAVGHLLQRLAPPLDFPVRLGTSRLPARMSDPGPQATPTAEPH